MRGGEVTERPRTGAWKTAVFKERGGNHGKPMKKTKEEQSKGRRDRRRTWNHVSQGRRVLKRRQ